jgi:hypothetical protein
MHALNRVSRVTGDFIYNTLAIELAKTAHARFTYDPSSGGQKRMYWKMSIDLSYPLVESMGHHDPLDGFITYSQLQATAAKDSERSMCLDLNAEITDMANICEGKSWATDDPLGLPVRPGPVPQPDHQEYTQGGLEEVRVGPRRLQPGDSKYTQGPAGG